MDGIRTCRDPGGPSEPYPGRVTGDEVRTITFREALWGYLPKEVDRKLVEIADALDAGLSPAAMLANLDFRKALRGYNVKDVDGLLDRLRSS